MKYYFSVLIFLLSSFGMAEIEIRKKLPYKMMLTSYVTSELLKILLIGGGGFLAFEKAKEKNLLPKLLQNTKLTPNMKDFFAIPVVLNFLLYFYFQHKTLTLNQNV